MHLDKTENKQGNGRTAHREQRAGAVAPECFGNVGQKFKHRFFQPP